MAHPAKRAARTDPKSGRNDQPKDPPQEFAVINLAHTRHEKTQDGSVSLFAHTFSVRNHGRLSSVSNWVRVDAAMRIARHTGILLLLLVSPLMAPAQSFEVIGSAGYGRALRFGDSSPGAGVFWGIGGGFRPFSRIRVEGVIENLDALSHETDHVANVLYPRASLAYELSGGKIRPFVLGGAGAARIREIQTITFPSRVEMQEVKETAFAVHFGGGVSFQATRRIAIRPQLAFIAVPASRSNIHFFNTSIQIGLGW